MWKRNRPYLRFLTPFAVLNLVDDPSVLKGMWEKHARFVSGIGELNRKHDLFSEICVKGLFRFDLAMKDF